MNAQNANYSILKDTMLKMWVPPAVGVQTVGGLFARTYNELFDVLFKTINIPRDIVGPNEDTIKLECDKIFQNLVFKTDFENYFDAQPPSLLDEAILTGSISEGLFLYTLEAPDMDFMCVLKNIVFSQEDQEDGTLLLREDTPFVYAFIKNKIAQNLWSEFLHEENRPAEKRRLSSTKLKKKLEENYHKTSGFFHTFGKENLSEVAEGAAVTVHKPKATRLTNESFFEVAKEFLRQRVHGPWNFNGIIVMWRAIIDELVPSSDIVLSIFCEGWPRCAREWISRERFWPDMHSVAKIMQSGFHVVPKSSPDGDFRLSFSCAETTLIKSLSPLQHRVMRAFKAVVKHHSQNAWNPSVEGIISSYHLKTISFWHFEKTSKESWTEDTLVHHLVTLLQDLAGAVGKRNLPMYFMPKVNLFQDDYDPEVMLDLMEKISRLSHDFSAMSEAVKNKNTLREASVPFTDFNQDTDELAKAMVDALLEEKMKKEEEGGESSFTFYDLFVLMENLSKFIKQFKFGE